jgi:hypothetical protein
MTAPVADALPYGVRDCKLTEYADAQGTVLGDTSVDLPYMQHLNFTEAEEFSELRGDDRLITTRGKGSQVNGDIEAGGMKTDVWAIITGGEVIETGLTPNRIIELRKRATTARPFFRVDGKVISDSGGDILVRIYRCRANGDLTANFQDGEFQTSQIAFVGMPLLDDTNDLIYSIFRRETSADISLTPDPNPVPAPTNLTTGTLAATSAGLLWNPVVGATAYVVETGAGASEEAVTTWTTKSPNPTVANVTVSSLTANTQYWARVASIVNGEQSDWCPAITFTTPAS